MTTATVFLSHASADGALAAELCSWLKSEGHVPFLDRDPDRGLAVGESWEEGLYRELRAADATICLLTAAYLASTWCHTEIGIAKTMGSLLLPVRAEPHVDHPLVAASRYQYVDYAANPTTARAELGRRLRRLDAGGGAGWPDDRSPFPGLDSFDTNLHRAFFGRRAEVRALIGRLRALGEAERGLLVVVGPSGCGKSSLIRAGLLPLLTGESDWIVLPALRPGAEPTAALARALATTAHQRGLNWTMSFARTQLKRSDGLARLAEELLVAGPGPASHRLLITVDQAEELLTNTSAPARSAFAGLLKEAVAGPVQLMATLRSEYLDPLLAEQAFIGLPVTAFPLRPLARELLPQVIEGPARLAGLRVDAELVGQLVADTGSGEGLPLLAFTLNQLAGGLSRGDALSVARYDELGGVRGALAGQANAALAAACAATGRSQAEVLAGLLQLVTVDEQGRPIRRRVNRGELAEPLRREWDAFVAHRLLTTDAEDGAVWLGVAHEAVLSGWPPLMQAIRDAAAALRARETVEQAATDWAQAGRRDDFLWERDRILAVTSLLAAPLPAGPPPSTIPSPPRRPGRRSRPARPEHGLPIDGQVPLSPVGSAFVHAGWQRAEAAQQRIRRRRIQAFSVLSGLLVLALVAGGIAFVQWQTAEREQRIATAQQLVGRAEAARATDPRTALMLAIAARRIHNSPETQTSLINTLTTAPYASALTGHTGSVNAVAFAPDGRTLATASDDQTVRLWNVTDPARPGPLGLLLGHTAEVYAVAFARDGRTLATGGLGDIANPGDMAMLWDVAVPQTPALLSPLIGHADSVYGVAFSPDGRTLATASADKTVMLWDVTAPDRPALLTRLTGHTDEVYGVAFSPDGRTLATSSTDTTVLLWDVKDRNHPRLLTRLKGHTDSVYGVAFSPDGRTLATSSTDTTVLLWDVKDRNHPRLLTRLKGQNGAVLTVAFAADGRTLATGGRNTTVLLWNVAEPGQPRLLARLTGQNGAVLTVAFAADGRTLAISSTDRTVILWDLNKLNGFRNRPLQHACALAGRSLSRDEWARYVPGLPYQNTCPP